MPDLFLHEIRELLDDPYFDPSRVVVMLSLPEVDIDDSRSMTLEGACDMLDQLAIEVGGISLVDARLLKQELERVQARGLTAVLRLEATAQSYDCTVEAIEIRAATES
jgi:hypothetical protein